MIYWLTGQRGTGKTAIALALKGELELLGRLVIHIDEHDLAGSSEDLTEANLLENQKIAQRLVANIDSKNLDVVVSLVSPCRSLREEFTQKHNVLEVHVHNTVDRCGREQGYEKCIEPRSTVIELCTSNTSVGKCVQQVLDADPSRLPLILYTSITGQYDSIPQILPEQGVQYWLFTDDPSLHVPLFWNKAVLPNPHGLSTRRLSRIPKLQPHVFLPRHAVSVYIDANITQRRPIRQFALECIRDFPFAAHAHPNTNCLYAEADKCIQLCLDDEEIIRSQMNRYRTNGFPKEFGLTENGFLVRRNIREVNRFNDMWSEEYSAGSQRDQLSMMYSLWHTGLGIYIIQQNSRINPYYKIHRHLVSDRPRSGRLKQYRGPQTMPGLQALIATLPQDIQMVELGSFAGESAEIFASSGKVKRIWCVDHWVGSAQNGERAFDEIQACYPDIIGKLKAESAEGAQQFLDQSLDFVYIDACQQYKSIKRDIELWRPKIRPGGVIGGHDYSPRFEGVIRAVGETFGTPDAVFQDSSWIVRIPDSTFGIVSYCSLGYLDAFEFTIDSWLEHACASEIVVYTDHPKFENIAKPRENVRFVYSFTPPAEELPRFPQIRKVEAIQSYFESTTRSHFAYLDIDCWVHRDFREVFQNMGQAHVVGTRLLGRDLRGNGEANSGVIFFRRHTALTEFFKGWKTRALQYRKQRRRKRFEQDAVSHLLIESFDGLHPFQASLVSEHIYNCEHDDDNEWLRAIAQYHPKILHFKKRRFRNQLLKDKVLSQISDFTGA